MEIAVDVIFFAIFKKLPLEDCWNSWVQLARISADISNMSKRILKKTFDGNAINLKREGLCDGSLSQMYIRVRRTLCNLLWRPSYHDLLGSGSLKGKERGTVRII